jgi:hypothetical protein
MEVVVIDVEGNIAAWLKRWLDRRKPALVLLSPSAERIPTDEDWTPTESSTVYQHAEAACERALARVGAG